MEQSWFFDPTGVTETLLRECATVEAARSLYEYVMEGGQIVVSARGAQFYDRGLAVILSLHFEALEGADVEERYARYGALGPEGTRFGIAIAGSHGSLDLSWADRLAAVGLHVEHVRDWDKDGRLRALVTSRYQVRIGRDFS